MANHFRAIGVGLSGQVLIKSIAETSNSVPINDLAFLLA
jgi:hypothetical protein